MQYTDTSDPKAANHPAQADSSASDLPHHILIGYWHNWQSPTANFIHLKDVSPDFDVIHVAFAIAAASWDGSMAFSPSSQSGVVAAWSR